jgi:hypothetical protein
LQYLTFRRYSEKELVTITISIAPLIEGTVVHEYCTGHCSHVFTSVFKEAFPKANSRARDLAATIKTTPQAFGFFIQWVYKHQSDLPTPSIADWISVWILADKLWIPKLQNFAINAINLNLNLGAGLTEQDFLNIWKNTSKRSALRNFFADAVAICCPTFDSANILPKNMMLDVYDVWKKSYEETGKSHVERKDRCIQKYYVNED